MDSRPKVSIIIPCFNSAEYLLDTLESVQNQTYCNWECIVMDDGSLDNTKQIVTNFCLKDSRFCYLYQDNQGPSVARNNAICHSSGYYILPLDSDDTISPSYIEKAVDCLETTPKIKLVYCLSDTLGIPNSIIHNDPYCYEDILWENMIHVSSVFRRSDFDKTKGYNPNMREGFEDWDYYLSFLSPNDHVHLIEEPLLHVRTNIGSRNHNALNNIQKLTQQLFENHKELYEPYVNDLVYYHGMWNYYKKQYNDQRRSFRSKAYKVGKTILAPFYSLRKIIKLYIK